MGAGLDHATRVEHDDQVGVAHRRQAVCNHDGGTVGLEAVERVAHGLLVDRVEVRGRLVEHQDRRVLEEGTGDRDALALAAGQRGTALADRRVEPLGQGRHQPVERGMPQGLLQFMLRGIRPRDQDVGAQAVIEEVGVLRDQRDQATQFV